MRRRSMSRRQSKKVYRKGMKVHRKNFMIPRGGIRA